MERTAYKSLIEWKLNPHRKPLILNGARQVGKTYLLQQFGQREYDNVAYINCDNNTAVAKVFENDFDISRVLLNLQAIAHQPINAGTTLLILDEIQAVPHGLHSLKYFAEQAPQLHVAAAGSLIGIAMHAGESFPVGKVDHLMLFPMTFEEFLDAAGESQLLAALHHEDLATLNDLNTLFEARLRQYYYVGGMPAVVSEFVTNHSLATVRTLQQNILYDYEHDFSKHAPLEQVPRINQVWQSIPSQLARDNKKFIYAAIKKGARAAAFELAIQWLVDAGVVYKVPRVKRAVPPLKFYEDLSAFKLYLCDCGLLGAMVGTDAGQVLVNNQVLEEYKGMFTEQYVLSQLKAAGADGGIYYYSTDDSRTEVDFVIQNSGKVTPIEVKAAENLRSKSLRQLVNDNPSLHGVRFSMSGYREQDWMTNVPLWAVCRLFAPSLRNPLP